ncbi:hypothetical protein N2K95_08790 [Arthrobacter zhaoxinii]|uniref:Uncharacterized protein n=1 Tax=Arthrobacter zhaoxinii TaxID=2964616 RepID=A0ABY5YL42_9MICC|nr:hypothetical protein [Arthrobacter zhaoxinii]UWX95799.1 hypothetical protein N2K95_08790 [Arthrobacter zhaoxinii]
MVKRRQTKGPWLAAGVPWIFGLYLVYVVSAQYTGLGLLDSYAAFQGGSHLGNTVWLVLWTGITFISCWFLAIKAGSARGRSKAISFILYAYSIPAVLLFMPDAAMGFAVSHVRAFTDGSAPHSVMVDLLVLSGVGAALLALVLPHVLRLKGRRQPRT